MKIVLNIEKKHLIFFSLFLILAGSVFVIANPQYPAKVGHAELQTDKIYPFTSQEGMINIPGNLRIGNNGDGTSWRVGINGNTIMRGNLRVEENLCDKDNNCISVKDLIDKMEELGVEEDQTQTPTGGIIYGNDNFLRSSQNSECTEENNQNIKEIIIPYAQLINKENIKISAKGMVFHENHRLFATLTLKKGDQTIKKYPLNDLRIAKDIQGACYIAKDAWCEVSETLAINEFRDSFEGEDLKIKFIACANHRDGETKNRNLGQFDKDSITATLQ